MGLTMLSLLFLWALTMTMVLTMAVSKAATVTGNRVSVVLPSGNQNVLPLESEPSQRKVGVLLLNLGGPETLADVEGFLYNLFADPDIIRIPRALSFLQKPIARYISKTRAPKSSIGYQSIGGGSPIVNYTTAQANLLQTALRQQHGINAHCYFAMRYWRPFTDEVLKQIKDDKIDTLIILPLYPQYSISTSGSSLKVLQELFDRDPGTWREQSQQQQQQEVQANNNNNNNNSNKQQQTIKHTVVPSWYFRPGYVDAMAQLILKEIMKFNESEWNPTTTTATNNSNSNSNKSSDIHVLFSAHGVPESYVRSGDPYKRHIEECVRLISNRVSQLLLSMQQQQEEEERRRRSGLLSWWKSDSNKNNDSSNSSNNKRLVDSVKFHLSFQSRVGPVQWLHPYTDDVIVELCRKDGVQNLIAVPVSFVSEHIETLEEIDMEYKELALENGVVHWERAAALNTDSGFINDLAFLVAESLDAPQVSVEDAIANLDAVPVKSTTTGATTTTTGAMVMDGKKPSKLMVAGKYVGRVLLLCGVQVAYGFVVPLLWKQLQSLKTWFIK